jgi:RNA recognition motif-containing protein
MAKELYVGNLSYDATEEDLQRLFSVAGTVTSVHIITDPESGVSKGCAYVRMSQEDEIKDAIESLDGALVGDRIITVSVARPQQQRKPGAYQGKGRPGGRPGKGRR